MTKSPRRLLFFLLLSLPVWVNANVLDRMIEDVRVSRTGDQATVQIALGCRMRLLEQQPDDGGTRLRIVLVMDNQCRNAAGGAMNEVSRPSGAGLADIDEVFFDTPGNGRGVVTLTFERPVGFVVSQQVTGGLTVAVDLGTSEFAATPPVSSSAATAQVDRQSATRPNTPRPLRLRPAESDSERYSLLLGVFQDAEIAAEGIPEAFRDFTTYTTEIPVGNRFWQGLHLGFFATEPEAQQAIAQLQSIYPDVWVVVVDKRQQTEAVANQVQPSETQILPEPAPAIEGANLETTTLASLMKAGKQSIVERQYQQAINAYTQVLSVEDNPHRRQAREFLGLAFERNGQLDHAKSEYQRYLNDYPNAPELARVQSRLNALSTIDQDIQATRQPEPQSGDVSPWNTYAGFAQYFRYNIEEIPNGLGQVDELSGITTYGNLNVERTGERFDLATRVNASYYYETVSDDGSVGNTGWVSHAYLDVMDKELGLEGRIGRQTRNGTGVLGRFDGLYLGYRFKPWVSFNAVLGRPVESPRFQYNDRRFFYGLSVNFESLLDGLDFTLFNHRQTVDGIEDRNAVGGEAHYSTNRWNVIAVTDYDLGYQTLNTALVSAHYRLGEETTINGFFDFGAQPYLTTQNALAGQLVSSIEELRQSFTEGQIRTIARDRTAQAYRGSLGISRPISDKYKLNADITYTEYDATVASAGVAALPASGAQIFYNMTMTRTGWFRPGNLTLLSLRYEDTRTYQGTTFTFDTRYPLWQGFRLNPRLSLSQRDNADDSTQLIAAGSVRLLYRCAERFLLEFEGGIRWSDREFSEAFTDPFFPTGTEEILGNYFSLGYRAEF